MAYRVARGRIADGAAAGIFTRGKSGINHNIATIEVSINLQRHENHLVIVAGFPLNGTIHLKAVGTIPVTALGNGCNEMCMIFTLT